MNFILFTVLLHAPEPVEYPQLTSSSSPSSSPSSVDSSSDDLSSEANRRAFCHEVSPDDVEACLYPAFVDYCRNGVIIFLTFFSLLLLTVYISRNYLQTYRSIPFLSRSIGRSRSLKYNQRETLFLYSEHIDHQTYLLAQQICLVSLAVAFTAILLLPLSIMSHELILGGVWNIYYLQWLTGGLLDDFWRVTSLGINVLLFIMLPFSYFLFEAEGFAGTGFGVVGASFANRISEAIFCLIFTLLLVFGLSWTCRQIYLASYVSDTITEGGSNFESPHSLPPIKEFSSVENVDVEDQLQTQFYVVYAEVGWNIFYRLISEVTIQLSLIHASLSVIGLLLLLVCSPAGVWAMVQFFIQTARNCWPSRIRLLLVKRQSGEEREELQEVLRLQLGWLHWARQTKQSPSYFRFDRNNSSSACRSALLPRQAPQFRTSSFPYLCGTDILEHDDERRHISSQLSTYEKLHQFSSSRNDRERRCAAIRRFLYNPIKFIRQHVPTHLVCLIPLVLVLLLCTLSLLYVVSHLLSILAGWERLSETLQQPTRLGQQRSLSPWAGRVGAFIQMILVVFFLLSSLVGLYQLPVLRMLRPQRGATTLSMLIGNCACLLLISKALPLQVRILGITSFSPLPGFFVRLDWLVGRDRALLLYDICYLTVHVVCFFTGLRKPLNDLINEFWHLFYLSKNMEPVYCNTSNSSVNVDNNSSVSHHTILSTIAKVS